MHDLPKEQGERFRINLYDHGSGLAVGDYDNDGHEDIYFLDQHGPNALYRNTGDGSFVDVTAQAGVALGDRISVGATFADYDNDGWPRSEERRVGKEGRCRWSPSNIKKDG